MRRNTGSQQMWFLSKCRHTDTQLWHAHTHLATYSSSESSHQSTFFIITYSCHVTIKKYLIVILYTCPYLLFFCLFSSVRIEYQEAILSQLGNLLCEYCVGRCPLSEVCLIYYTQRICNWLSSRRLVIVSVGLAAGFLQLSLY
jgi:hypothetical protein